MTGQSGDGRSKISRLLDTTDRRTTGGTNT